MVNTLPNTTHETTNAPQKIKENETESEEAKEIVIQSLDFNGATTSFEPPKTLSTTNVSYVHETRTTVKNSTLQIPLLIVTNSVTSRHEPVTTQPLRTFSKLPSPMSLNNPLPNQPQSLLSQALTKLNDSTFDVTALNRIRNNQLTISPVNSKLILNTAMKSIVNEEISAPNSLTSAPPSYSFVLRQMEARRRPRLMGTFIPSPSFVQHTPPPNYAAAFDIYVDNPIPRPPPRIVNYSFMSAPAVCHECGFTGMTVVRRKITICTHLCALFLCLFCCWICAPLPYMLGSCKDVYHYCRNCGNLLGMYCPTNPNSTYP